mmetsp:Transcript_4008/g.10132  ORF Transcript_4008/g.10132 Transcript_4008/m.10132 type:complete len:291 (+) Transcript_4008:858-1730(+)
MDSSKAMISRASCAELSFSIASVNSWILVRTVVSEESSSRVVDSFCCLMCSKRCPSSSKPRCFSLSCSMSLRKSSIWLFGAIDTDLDWCSRRRLECELSSSASSAATFMHSSRLASDLTWRLPSSFCNSKTRVWSLRDRDDKASISCFAERSSLSMFSIRNLSAATSCKPLRFAEISDSKACILMRSDEPCAMPSLRTASSCASKLRTKSMSLACWFSPALVILALETSSVESCARNSSTSTRKYRSCRFTSPEASMASMFFRCSASLYWTLWLYVSSTREFLMSSSSER